MAGNRRHAGGIASAVQNFNRIQTEAATAAADDSPYKPGDPPPGGYLNWHAWAEVQDKAGLRQKRCPECGLWKFPQELSGLTCFGCSTSGAGASGDAQPKGGA